MNGKRVTIYHNAATGMVKNESSFLDWRQQTYPAWMQPADIYQSENLVVENGDYQGTQINSSNMLWSLSGNLSITYKVLFGIRFHEDNLSFSPFVPKAIEGKSNLTNFTYRKAVIDSEMEGYGNKIARFSPDGKVNDGDALPWQNKQVER